MHSAGPTDEQLLAAAGSARYGRLLVRGELGELAVAVVDANGDDALYECVILRRQDGRWAENSSGFAGLLAEGWASGVAYAYGRAPGARVVEVGRQGDVRPVRVDEHGWWLVLSRAEEDERFDLSAVPLALSVRRRRDDGRPPRIAG